MVGRITLFPTPLLSPPLPSTLELYRSVWDGDPDNFQKQGNALMPTFAQGKRGDVMAICSVHPARIDFHLGPVLPENLPERESLVLIEDTSQLRAELMRIIEFVGKGGVSNSISRVALNVQFLVSRASTIEANKLLISVMPDQYRVQITDEEDFIFQINRPYMSREVKGVRMNSLTKWSVDRLKIVSLLVDMTGSPTPASASNTAPKLQEFIAASVTFDNNNVPAGNNLAGEQQAALLLEELSAAARMQRDFGLHVEGF